MDDNEAFQLLDAHLDRETLTAEQAAGLRSWLNEQPEHADRAFHRIFLHAFLREGLQHASLQAPRARTIQDDSALETTILEGELIDLRGDLAATHNHVDRIRSGPIKTRRIIVVLILLACACWPAIWFMVRSNSLPNPPVTSLWLYEGFDYSPTSPSAPLGDGNKWPTSGGMQGLNGGVGWAEPWRETAPKVSILIADVQANAWRASDMRKFGPLGYADAQGHVLKSSGIQLRTAAGPTSSTSRMLDVKAFPASMSDEEGLGKDGSVLWMSFLAQSFDARGLGNFAYLQLGTDVAGFRLGKLTSVPSGNWAASGVMDGAETNVVSSEISSGRAVFLVTRIRFQPGTEEADVWIDPPLKRDPSAASPTLHISLPDFHWDQLSIKSRYTTDFDEIRIGGSFGDVVPIR